MDIAINILIGVVVLSIIALAHELGHFVTGKMIGAKVEEFGLGLPPRIFGVKVGETIYSINAIPFGAFNRFLGEEDPKEPRSLASKSAPARFLVLSAGSLANVVIAVLLFSAAFMVPHDAAIEPVIIKSVAPGSPAEAAGIRDGDTILSVDGQPVKNIVDLHRYIQLNLGSEIAITTRHLDSSTEDIRLTPRWSPPEGEGAIGVMLDVETAMANRTIVRESYPFWQAIPMGTTELAQIFVLNFKGLVSMFTGATPAELVGPVGIVHLTGEAARVGFGQLLEFAAIISLLLAIFNLFPIPALDGGRLVFIFIEWLRHGKRAVSPRTEGLIHFVGLALMLALFVLVAYRDIMRIISGGSLLP